MKLLDEQEGERVKNHGYEKVDLEKMNDTQRRLLEEKVGELGHMERFRDAREGEFNGDVDQMRQRIDNVVDNADTAFDEQEEDIDL